MGGPSSNFGNINPYYFLKVQVKFNDDSYDIFIFVTFPHYFPIFCPEIKVQNIDGN